MEEFEPKSLSINNTQYFYKFIVDGRETFVNPYTIMNYSKESKKECLRVHIADTSIITRGVSREFLCCRDQTPDTYIALYYGYGIPGKHLNADDNT
jgi:hypothetical protein